MLRALPLLMALGFAACSSGGEAGCQVNADCASLMCGADGRCVAPLDGAPAGDGALTSDGAPGGDGAACVPDHDGSWTRAEVPLGAGLSARFRIAAGASFATAGSARGDGTRRWDLSGALTGDHDVTVATLPVAGQWFASAFAGASYAAKLRDSEELLGVFEVTPQALLLRGVVSPQGGVSRTELTYDPPAQVLAFPLRLAGNFRSTSTVSGLAQGFFTTYQEMYESDGDARGELVTPYGSFPALRVRVVLRRTIGVVTTTVRSYLWLAECYGTVAAVAAQDNEPSIEFTSVAEARRLAP